MIPKCMFGKRLRHISRAEQSRWVKNWRSPKTILKQRLIIIREQTAIITWPPPSAVFQGRSAGLGDERKQLIIKRGSRPFWFRQQIISNMPEDFVKPKGDWIENTWHCVNSLKNWWNANRAAPTSPEHDARNDNMWMIAHFSDQMTRAPRCRPCQQLKIKPSAPLTMMLCDLAKGARHTNTPQTDAP